MDDSGQSLESFLEENVADLQLYAGGTSSETETYPVSLLECPQSADPQLYTGGSSSEPEIYPVSLFECPQEAFTTYYHPNSLSSLGHSEECPSSAQLEYPATSLQYSQIYPPAYYTAPALMGPPQTVPSSYPSTSRPQTSFHPNAVAAPHLLHVVQGPAVQVGTQATTSEKQDFTEEPSGFLALLLDSPQEMETQSDEAVNLPQPVSAQVCGPVEGQSDDMDVTVVFQSQQQIFEPLQSQEIVGVPVSNEDVYSEDPPIYMEPQSQEIVVVPVTNEEVYSGDPIYMEPQSQEIVGAPIMNQGVVFEDTIYMEPQSQDSMRVHTMNEDAVPKDPEEGSPQSDIPTPEPASLDTGGATDQRLVREFEAMNFGDYLVKIPAVPETQQQPTPEEPRRRAKKTKTTVTCALCPKQFENSYKLKLHLNSHTGERPFICDVCSRGFFRGPNLNAHRRTHKGPGPFRCKDCGHRFWHRGDLEVHLVTEACLRLDVHKGVACSTCLTCGKGPFPSQASFRAHARQHNRGQGTSCPVCRVCVKGQKGRLLLAHVKEFHQEYFLQRLRDGAEESAPTPKE